MKNYFKKYTLENIKNLNKTVHIPQDKNISVNKNIETDFGEFSSVYEPLEFEREFSVAQKADLYNNNKYLDANIFLNSDKEFNKVDTFKVDDNQLIKNQASVKDDTKNYVSNDIYKEIIKKIEDEFKQNLRG